MIHFFEDRELQLFNDYIVKALHVNDVMSSFVVMYSLYFPGNFEDVVCRMIIFVGLVNVVIMVFTFNTVTIFFQSALITILPCMTIMFLKGFIILWVPKFTSSEDYVSLVIASFSPIAIKIGHRLIKKCKLSH